MLFSCHSLNYYPGRYLTYVNVLKDVVENPVHFHHSHQARCLDVLQRVSVIPRHNPNPNYYLLLTLSARPPGKHATSARRMHWPPR